jgi:hypothetical protein
MSDRMPRRGEVDPDFDGHLDRPFATWTMEERLAWLEEAMTLLRAGARRRTPPVPEPPPSPD